MSWKAILLWIRLGNQSQCHFYVTLAFMAVSLNGLPEANENKWRPPIKAVSNGINIKYT